MKDEEMAEEYADEKCKDCYMCSYSEHKNPYKICQRRKDRKQGFLAGLKAGRPQWHKVADGDLPKENKLYLLAIKENGLAIAYFNGRHWETKFNLGDFGHLVETVIAWCEIPTFDKE
jgi:hypothetical protein